MAKQPKETKTAPTNTQAPTDVEAFDWAQEQSTGFEATRAEDLGIPFLSLMQKGSPEVDEDHKDHETKKIEGVESGMVINTVTRQIVYEKDESKPLIFVPAFHEKLYQEWKPRNEGGGFVQSHRSSVILTRCSRNEKNKDVLPSGNEIITTSYFYGHAFLEGTWVRVILSFTSTQLKKARMWLNLMHSLKVGGVMPPMFSHAYSLTTVKEQNAEGTWWGWKIDVNRTLNKADMEVITTSRQIALEASKSILALPAASTETEVTGADEQAESEARRPGNR